eukprot:14144689-Alexandrium_andersonii.AAC.1
MGSGAARHLARASPVLRTGMARRVRAIVLYSGSVRPRAASAGMAVRRTAEPGMAKSDRRLRSIGVMLLISQ